MFIHLLLLLPTVEPAELVINEYSMKQVKVDDNLINQVLSNIFPEAKGTKVKHKGSLVKLNADSEPDEIEHSEIENPNGFMRPSFDTVGQTRFKKITNRASMDKFNLRDKNMSVKSPMKMKTVDEDDTEVDPLFLLSKLVVRLLEYLPPQFKVPVSMPHKKKKPMSSNNNVMKKIEIAES